MSAAYRRRLGVRRVGLLAPRRRLLCLRSRVDERNRGREGRAEAERALDRHVAAQQGGELAHEGQPEAGAAARASARDCRAGRTPRRCAPGPRARCRCPCRRREQTTDAPSRRQRAVTRISPRSVNFSAFERKLRRICETLPSSVRMSGHAVGLLEHEGHRLVHEQRAQHAAQGAEEVPELELRRPHDDLARLHLGQVEQVVHQLGQVVGGLADVAHLLGLLGGERARRGRRAGARDRARIEFSGVRNSWLMLRQEARLQLVGAAQVSAFSSSSA